MCKCANEIVSSLRDAVCVLLYARRVCTWIAPDTHTHTANAAKVAKTRAHKCTQHTGKWRHWWRSGDGNEFIYAIFILFTFFAFSRSFATFLFMPFAMCIASDDCALNLFRCGNCKKHGKLVCKSHSEWRGAQRIAITSTTNKKKTKKIKWNAISQPYTVVIRPFGPFCFRIHSFGS